MKTILSVIVGVILFVGLAFGSWKLERYVHYKLAYQPLVQSEVEKQLKPLNERISKLEAEVQGMKSK